MAASTLASTGCGDATPAPDVTRSPTSTATAATGTPTGTGSTTTGTDTGTAGTDTATASTTTASADTGGAAPGSQPTASPGVPPAPSGPPARAGFEPPLRIAHDRVVAVSAAGRDSIVVAVEADPTAPRSWVTTVTPNGTGSDAPLPGVGQATAAGASPDGSRVVVVGGARDRPIAWSRGADGTWLRSPLPPQGDGATFEAVSHVGDRFVGIVRAAAAPAAARHAVTSADGVAWDRLGDLPGVLTGPVGFAAGDDAWVVVAGAATGGGSAVVASADDGASWVRAPASGTPDGVVLRSAVAGPDGRVLALGLAPSRSGGPSRALEVHRSRDGGAWEPLVRVTDDAVGRLRARGVAVAGRAVVVPLATPDGTDLLVSLDGGGAWSVVDGASARLPSDLAATLATGIVDDLVMVADGDGAVAVGGVG